MSLERGKVRGTRPRETASLDPLDFALPPELEAGEPPEARGLARDEVRLMVSHRSDDRVVHTRFREIGEHLRAGNLLVINTSGTLNAALRAVRPDGTPLELHLSTHLPADLWTVELRLPTERGTAPFHEGVGGETLRLPGDASVTLLTPYARDRATRSAYSPRACGCHVRAAVSAPCLPRPARLPNPLELREGGLARELLSDGVRDRGWGARRCRPPGAPSPRRC